MYIVEYKGGTTERWTKNGLGPSDSLYKDILCLEAYSEELEYIQKQYRFVANNTYGYSIPMPENKDKVIWYGDIAKTIVANL